MKHYLELTLDDSNLSKEIVPILIDIHKINFIYPLKDGRTSINFCNETIHVTENMESIVARIKDLEDRNSTENNHR